MRKLFFVLLAMTLVSCSGKLKTTPDKKALTERTSTFQNLFPNVQIHFGADLAEFVEKVNSVSDTAYVKKINLTGIVASSVIVDTVGRVKKIICRNSLNPEIDQAVFSAINESRFKQIKNSTGKATEYFIDLTHIFYKGNILVPLVNGRAIPNKATDTKPLPKQDEKFEFFQVSEKPVLTKITHAKYSYEARKAEAQGRVTVMVTIAKTGLVEKVNIIRSDHDLLIISSLDAASQCQFKPAKQRGELVRVKMSLPFDYRLGN